MVKFLALLLGLAPGLAALPEFHLAILGKIPESKTVETMAARFAVDAFNAVSGRPKARLLGFDTQGSLDKAVAAAQRLAADPKALGVVVLGEEGADPAVLSLLDSAGLAVVMASSWASPRPAGLRATWLCPPLKALAQVAAEYARTGKRAAQAAVVDNGSPTSAAAAREFARRFRELGGRVDYSGEWQGSGWGMTRTVKELQANWPQVVFFSGEAAEAGKLAKAMRGARELKEAHLLGLPSLLGPDFFKEGRLDAKLSSAVFPAPDYRGSAQFSRATGVSFPRSSPAYKAYVSYAYRKPGRWSSMAFDAAKLLLDAAAQALPGGHGLPLREELRDALAAIPGYRGIRGDVEFSPSREPSRPKAMVYYALPKVNSKQMLWYDKEFGPPFR